MTRATPLRRPSGSPAPEEGTAPDGTLVDLRAAAGEVADRFAAEFPDERERHGDGWRAWCVHDNQHILAWALLDAAGLTTLDAQVGWLARVLAARGYPVERLERDLELCADVMGEGAEPWRADVAERLRRARTAVQARSR